MPYSQFIKIISKYLNRNDYDFRFKKSPYYNENEMWIYRKDDDGESKRSIIGYELNGKSYRTKKSMLKDCKSGSNNYSTIYGIRNSRMGLLITEETLINEEYLKELIASY